MSRQLEQIAARFDVPATRGARIRFGGELATIVGARRRDGRLKVRFDDGRQLAIHPTFRVEYLADAQERLL